MAQRRNKKSLVEQYRPIGIKSLAAAGQWQEGKDKDVPRGSENDREDQRRQATNKGSPANPMGENGDE